MHMLETLHTFIHLLHSTVYLLSPQCYLIVISLINISNILITISVCLNSYKIFLGGFTNNFRTYLSEKKSCGKKTLCTLYFFILYIFYHQNYKTVLHLFTVLHV